LNLWFDKLGGKDKFVAFMSNSVATRIGDPKFEDKLNLWFDKLGGKDKFVAFMSGSVATRIGDPKFEEQLNLLLEIVTKDEFVKIISRCATTIMTECYLENFQKIYNNIIEEEKMILIKFFPRICNVKSVKNVNFWTNVEIVSKIGKMNRDDLINEFKKLNS